MAQDQIPPELEGFVARYIPSVERLEVLLLLFQARDRIWSLAEVQNQIQSSVGSIEKNIELLVASHLAVAQSDGKGFRYQSISPEIDGQILALAAAYRLRRVSVIELIYREHRDPLRSFSDAFKIRPPNDR